MGPFTRAVTAATSPFPVPVLAFPGARLTGVTVRDVVSSASAQITAQRALHERFGTPCLMSAMDLSVEAEEFGSEIQFSDFEVPTVTKRLITDARGIEALKVPSLGTRRTAVYIETVSGLASSAGSSPVLAGMIGPLSLAGRLFGVSEALLATATEPEMITELIEKSTQFLRTYARAFKEAGADAVIIAEPTAGLLSPPAVSKFSSRYIRAIVDDLQDSTFEVILHNCGARRAHLAPTFEAGAAAYHFGSPMDLATAIREAPAGTVVGGNLDPAAVFHDSTPGEVRTQTKTMLALWSPGCRFAPSSGCDIPYGTPLENLEAFFSAVSQAR